MPPQNKHGADAVRPQAKKALRPHHFGNSRLVDRARLLGTYPSEMTTHFADFTLKKLTEKKIITPASTPKKREERGVAPLKFVVSFQCVMLYSFQKSPGLPSGGSCVSCPCLPAP